MNDILYTIELEENTRKTQILFPPSTHPSLSSLQLLGMAYGTATCILKRYPLSPFPRHHPPAHRLSLDRWNGINEKESPRRR